MALLTCWHVLKEAEEMAAQLVAETKQKALALQDATQQHLESYKTRLLKDR